MEIAVETTEIGVNVGLGAKIILQNALFRRIVRGDQTPKSCSKEGSLRN